jgi:hypothetical protein
MTGSPKFSGKSGTEAMITVAEVDENTTLSPNASAQYQVRLSEVLNAKQR